MIEILPAEPETARRLAQAAAVAPEQVRALVLYDRKEPAGHVLYRSGVPAAELLFVQAEDETLREGLLRAALNAAMLEGAEEAVCLNAVLAPDLQRMGFEQNEEGWRVGLREFFNKKCRQKE